MRALVLASALCLPISLAVLAQEVGDPEAGLAVASEVCAACHVVSPDHPRSPDLQALPFEALQPLPFIDIANTPGVTEMVLYAWMASSHPTMPNIVLGAEELNDVIAYIISLKEERP